MEMDKQTEKHILNILRQGTITWHVRNEVLKRNRRKKVVGTFKNGKKKEVWERQCDGDCKEWFELREDMFEIDHIDPVGSFNGNFDVHIRRLFCEPENLQALCFICHKAKTAQENSTGVYQRKQIFQEEEEDTVEDSHDSISYLDVL